MEWINHFSGRQSARPNVQICVVKVGNRPGHFLYTEQRLWHIRSIYAFANAECRQTKCRQRKIQVKTHEAQKVGQNWLFFSKVAI